LSYAGRKGKLKVYMTCAPKSSVRAHPHQGEVNGRP